MSVEAPERIWAASVTDSYGEWQTVKDGLPRPVEYVRADKLEELAAENRRIAGLVTESEQQRYKKCSELLFRAEAAEAALAEAKRENEALREALETMVEMVEMNGFGRAYAMDVARAALKEASDERA